MINTQLHKLPTDKIMTIHKVMQEAALASELRGHGQAKKIFRQAKNRSIGLQKRVYEVMETATPAQLENMKNCLMDVFE